MLISVYKRPMICRQHSQQEIALSTFCFRIYISTRDFRALFPMISTSCVCYDVYAPRHARMYATLSCAKHRFTSRVCFLFFTPNTDNRIPTTDLRGTGPVISQGGWEDFNIKSKSKYKATPHNRNNRTMSITKEY